MASVEVFSEAPPSTEGPRKSRRLSLRPTSGNATAEGQQLAPRSSRFGFKPKVSKVVKVVAAASSTAAPPPAPIEVTNVVVDVLGDFEAYGPLLEPEKGRKGPKDYKWYQGAYEDIKETVKQLKAALRDQIERARSASSALEPLQAQVNERLQTLSEDATAQREVAQRASSELEATRRRAEERKDKIQELATAAESQSAELASSLERLIEQTERADTAEASLSERDAQLAAAVKQGEELRDALQAHTVAAEEAAEAARVEIERLKSEVTETMSTLETARADAHARETDLSARLQTSETRAAELDEKMSAALAEVSELRESKAVLEKEHTSVSEAAAATRARLESTQSQLDEKTSTLSQKDDDLREALRNVSQMQKDNQEALQHERSRSQALEEEARSLRSREQQAVAATAAADAETERVRGELELARTELAATQSTLAHANTERERLAIETAERFEALTTQQLKSAQLEAQLKESQEQLASTSATLEAKKEEAEKAANALHELQVEFRAYREHHGTSNQQQMTAISELKLTVDRLSQQVESKQTEVVSTQGSLQMQQAYLSTLEAKLREQEAMRRQLHNTIQELKGNIRVFCRVRPAKADAPLAIETTDAKLSISHASGSGGAAAEPHVFGFDKVFGPSTSQEAVFAEVDGLVQSSLDGYKVCIFAYGQTGTGKTHTMQGGTDPASWGLIPRALSKILEASAAMSTEGWTWTLSASFLEIYNETIRDLLHDPKTGAPPSYAIKHDEAWGSVVANMGRSEVANMEQINSLMARAAKARAVGCTDMNSQSSRSHSVFALYLQGVNSKLNTELHGALHLVDLAGSERLDKSGAVGAALKETQAINKSLSALKGVFASKASGASHVPFRDSKLTHLMEPCLSGQGKTLMVVNIAPEETNSHESLCSLRFASQVNQCDTGSAARAAPKRHAKAAAPAAAPPAKQARPATAGPSGTTKRK